MPLWGRFQLHRAAGMRHSSSPRGQTRLLYMDKPVTGLSCVANRPSLAAQLGEIPAGFQGHDFPCQNSRTRLYLMRIQQGGQSQAGEPEAREDPQTAAQQKTLLFSFSAAFNHQREPQAPGGVLLWVPTSTRTCPATQLKQSFFTLFPPPLFFSSCPVFKSESG